MKFISYLLFTFIIILSSVQANAQYTILTEFGSLTSCDTMTSGPFCIWWDNSFDAPENVSDFLDSLNRFRDVCINDLNMPEPSNIANGNYINYYLHQPDDVFPDYFGNFQSVDNFNNVFVTISKGYHLNSPNAAHETFHVFQDGATANFEDGDDGQWFFEASANWFKVLLYPNEDEAFITSQVLLKLPQVPLWYGWNNRPAEHPQNWQRENHQYALGYLCYYLTEAKGVSRTTISNGFTSGTSLTPQEYYVQTIGLPTFRSHFMDWIADMTNSFEFIPDSQEQRAIQEWSDVADQSDDKQFVGEYTNDGTGGWVRPDNTSVTAAWSFNTFKINNSIDETYTFELKGDALSNQSDPSHFQGQVVVINSTSGATVYPLNMLNNQEGSISINLTSEDTEAYFIVASMPEVYEVVEKLFSYEARIQTGIAVGLDPIQADFNLEIFPNPATDVLAIKLNNIEKNDIQVQLVDISGRLLATYDLNENELLISLKKYQAGTYFIHLISKDYRQIRKLIID